MQREQADPAGRMDRILMRMIAVDGDFVRNVMQHDDPVEQHETDKHQQTQREVIEHDPPPGIQRSAGISVDTEMPGASRIQTGS